MFYAKIYNINVSNYKFYVINFVKLLVDLQIQDFLFIFLAKHIRPVEFILTNQNALDTRS